MYWCLNPHHNLYFSQANALLIEAVSSRQFEAVKTYVNQGANVNVLDEEGYSPVLLGSYFGAADIVEYLLDKKANSLYQVGFIADPTKIDTHVKML